jgi:hypothetical protein
MNLGEFRRAVSALKMGDDLLMSVLSIRHIHKWRGRVISHDDKHLTVHVHSFDRASCFIDSPVHTFYYARITKIKLQEQTPANWELSQTGELVLKKEVA